MREVVMWEVIQKSKMFNPSDIPAKTLKELIVNEYEFGIAHGLVNKSVSFNPYDIPAETLKEMIIYNDYLQGANPLNEGSGYLTSQVQVPETLRQLISILRFDIASGNKAPKDYTAEKNMVIDEKKKKQFILEIQLIESMMNYPQKVISVILI